MMSALFSVGCGPYDNVRHQCHRQPLLHTPAVLRPLALNLDLTSTPPPDAVFVDPALSVEDLLDDSYAVVGDGGLDPAHF
jgi:hypothetical protein